MNEPEPLEYSLTSDTFGFGSREPELMAIAAALALHDGATLLTLTRRGGDRPPLSREIHSTKTLKRKARLLRAAALTFWRELRSKSQSNAG